jgi:putative CocE/NonD family hydrolase
MDFQPPVRRIAGLALRLPPRRSGKLSIAREVPIPMRDGAVLLADCYSLDGDTAAPVVLMRCPYGRGSFFGMIAALIAERGFRVVIQSVRGTAGSEGNIDPMRQEAADGADTVSWIKAQPWFSGRLFVMGASYLGNAAWAAASGTPDEIDGMGLSMTLSNFGDEILGGGGHTLAGTLTWTATMQAVVGKAGGQLSREAPDLEPAFAHLPVGSADEIAFGKPVPWWKDWTAHPDPEGAWWQAMDYSSGVTALKAPVSLVAGWQDIFLPFQLRDFAARQSAGLDSWLVIGPWTHAGPGGMARWLRDAAACATASPPSPRADGCGCMSSRRTNGATMKPGRRRKPSR